MDSSVGNSRCSPLCSTACISPDGLTLITGFANNLNFLHLTCSAEPPRNYRSIPGRPEPDETL